MRRLPRRLWLAVVPGAMILAALLAWNGGLGRSRGVADETWARVQREGVLRVGMDASYPPFEVQGGGQFQGYDVDLAREIGRRLGLQVSFVNVPFDGLYDALAAERCDVLVSALPYEAQRTRDVLYTGGYFNAGQVLMVRREERRIQSYRDLGGCQVAVELGSVAHQEALRLRDAERIALTIEAVPSSEEAFDLVQAGKADAALADRITARLALRERPGLALRGAPLTDESFVIAVARGSPDLHAALNGVLNALRGEGWLDSLADRWL